MIQMYLYDLVHIFSSYTVEKLSYLNNIINITLIFHTNSYVKKNLYDPEVIIPIYIYKCLFHQKIK